MVSTAGPGLGIIWLAYVFVPLDRSYLLIPSDRPSYGRFNYSNSQRWRFLMYGVGIHVSRIRKGGVMLPLVCETLGR